MTKYNFVFYSASGDYYEPLFSPLKGRDGVALYDCAFSSGRICQKLFSLHWSNKLNRTVPFPFKSLWFPRMYSQDFSNNKPTCYIFFGAKYASDNLDYLDYIKKKNPENKVVLNFGDLVAKKNLKNQRELFQKADLVLSYDPEECQQYGMTYLENLYYSNLLPITTPTTFDYDVFFLGYAKDRLDTIHAVWKRLSEQGLRCRFMIVGVRPEQRISGEGLCYMDKPIPYRESLEYIQRSRCIMELIQGKSVATTMRALEAVCYKRKLISNCPVLKESPLYSPENMLCFTDPEEIDAAAFASSPVDYTAYESVHTLSSEDYIRRIEELLLEKEHGNT